jgi:hypothetical protein
MSFTRLAPTDFVISSDSITAPAWSSNQPTLSTFFTASSIPSAGITQGAFYLNTYQTQSTATGAAVQFSIAYGNIVGSGSQWYNPLVPGVSPSLTTYRQYETLIYGALLSSSVQGFNFGGAATSAPDIFAINVDRNRYKENLFPGTFNLKISGSNGEIQLTDNSNDVTTVTYLDCGRVFNVVSGSNGYAAITSNTGQIANGYTPSGSYGLFLPDIGIIILNTSALALTSGFGGIGLTLDRQNYGSPSYTLAASASYTSTSNTFLYQAISRSANFQLNSQETISSDYIFVRIPNADYNYSMNPTFVSGSGNVLYSTMIYNPQTYITTIGLYNDNSELLAVAKMSRALVKDFTKEALIRVKLDW